MIVTAAPIEPLVGAKPVILGFTVKVAALVALPAELVTAIGPLDAPAGTTTVSWVFETPLKLVLAAPLKRTAVVPVKLVPVRVTVVPTTPLVGEKELIAGAAVESTVKLATLVPVPAEVTTLILPLAAPAGTPVEI